MARRFMNLTQGNLSVDGYASEFTRLARFAPKLVETEEEKARKFEEGLNYDIQSLVLSLHYPTFAEIVDAAREHEQLSLRHRETLPKQNTGGAKRPLPQDSVRQSEPAKRPAKNPSVECNYCGKTGHMRKDCRRANGLCLICGASDHLIPSCPMYKPNDTHAQYRSPAVANPRPPLPPQQQAYQQRNPQQNRNPTQQGRAYNLIAEPEDAADLLQPTELDGSDI